MPRPAGRLPPGGGRVEALTVSTDEAPLAAALDPPPPAAANSSGPATAGRADPSAPGGHWLLVQLPAVAGAEEDGGHLSLAAVASELAKFPAGRAAVSPGVYRRLRHRLPDGTDAFLQWGGHLLMI